MALERARELVMAHGWNATAYQILNPGIEQWFCGDPDGVVGYVKRRNVLLVAGAPVCRLEDLGAVCAAFEAFARQQRRRVCYVCAEERLREHFADASDHAAIALGAQPAWDPRRWAELVRERASLRAQLSRARNKGIRIEAVAPDTAAANPELRRVLRQWIQGRRLPPMHFLVEPDLLDGVLTDRAILLARRGDVPVAFVVASPVIGRSGYQVELLARTSEAPNGTSELLIDAAMQRFAGEGCRYVTLGLVALAHAADAEIAGNPAWIRLMMYFARAHANRFYNFRGLERFRVKMKPDQWEMVYAIANEPRFSVATLYQMGGAFSGIPPWAAIAIGMGKAIGSELRMLKK